MEKRYASLDGGRNPSNWSAGSRLPERSMNNEGESYMVNRRWMLNDPINSRFGGDGEETNLQIHELINHLKSGRGFRETYPQFKDLSGLLNLMSSRAGNNQWEERGERLQAFSRNPHEPQNRAPPFYGYSRSTHSNHDAYGPNSVENLERDRAELIRKLEQLNFQLARSEEMEPRLPINRHVVPSDRHNARFEHYNGPAPSTSPYDMEVPSIPVLPGNLHDPSGPRVVGTTSKYAHLSPNGHFLEELMEYVNPEPFESYPRDLLPPHLPGSRRILEDSFDPQFQHHVGTVGFRELDPDPFVFGSRDQSHSHESRLTNSGLGNSSSLGKAHTRIDLASDKSRKHRIAIAGGAPFIICSSCFNLLRLPQRLKIKEKDKDKARCGSCSAVICVKLEEKRLIACTIIEDSQEEATDTELSAVLNTEGNAQSSPLGLSDNCGLKSYNDTEQDFSPAKSEENSFAREQGVDVDGKEKIVGSISIISSSEEHEEAEEKGKGDLKEVIVERDDHTSPAHPGSPLEKNPQNSALMVTYKSQLKNGKNSDNTDYEKAFLQKSDLPHVSFKDNSEVTEVEVSASEYPITSLSQDSMDTSKEENQPRNKKGEGRSFFKGLMKRSVREQSIPEPIIENERAEVTVNGHPIPEDVVKQAEVLAGPIRPGDYW